MRTYVLHKPVDAVSKEGCEVMYKDVLYVRMYVCTYAGLKVLNRMSQKH
jgi:hypothetical protein